MFVQANDAPEVVSQPATPIGVERPSEWQVRGNRDRRQMAGSRPIGANPNA